MHTNDLLNKGFSLPKTERFPVLFVGHGNPMNAIEDNEYSRGWAALAATLPRPHAILCISAHWLTEGTFVHGVEKPRTIHDFWGFPPELYAVEYSCPGAPEQARYTQSLPKRTKVQWDTDWGVDHGTWSVLRRMFPKADVPVFQLSLDMSRPARFHYELGGELAALRDHGVLIIASGNLVHNLGMIAFDDTTAPFDWAVEFDTLAADLIEKGDDKALIEYEHLGHAAALAIPTPDHYWPLLYALALKRKDESATFPIVGISQGSIGMRSVLIR